MENTMVKFYYTDLDKKKQFALNPDKEAVEEVEMLGWI